jgi:hypothetical protein
MGQSSGVIVIRLQKRQRDHRTIELIPVRLLSSERIHNPEGSPLVALIGLLIGTLDRGVSLITLATKTQSDPNHRTSDGSDIRRDLPTC